MSGRAFTKCSAGGLHDALDRKVPVIGVAKTAYRSAADQLARRSPMPGS